MNTSAGNRRLSSVKLLRSPDLSGRSRIILVSLLAGLILSVDSLIKGYLRSSFYSGQSIPVIPNIFHITLVLNTGAAFGILRGKTILLVYIGLILLMAFFIFLGRDQKNKSLLVWIAGGLIVGGAVSNLWDRISLGYVVDYLDFRIWPVFNLSDACICTAAGLLMIDSFREKRV
jgi:signal peptidase II